MTKHRLSSTGEKRSVLRRRYNRYTITQYITRARARVCVCVVINPRYRRKSDRRRDVWRHGSSTYWWWGGRRVRESKKTNPISDCEPGESGEDDGGRDRGATQSFVHRARPETKGAQRICGGFFSPRRPRANSITSCARLRRRGSPSDGNFLF